MKQLEQLEAFSLEFCNNWVAFNDRLDALKDLRDSLESIFKTALEEVEKECIWEYESDDCFYQTSCDMAFQFSHDDVEQEFKHFKWCPYCGKRIKVKSQLKGE